MDDGEGLSQVVKPLHSAAHGSAQALNLRVFALACIGRLLERPASDESISQEQLYLQSFHRRLHDSSSLNAQLRSYLQQPAREDQRLMVLASTLRLNDFELLAIALALAVEADPMVGRILAFVQAPVGGSRPTLGLLESALAHVVDDQPMPWIAGELMSGMAVASGVLQVLNDQAPVPERSIKLPTALALALSNQHLPSSEDYAVNAGAGVLLPRSIQLEAQRQAEALISKSRSVLIIRSASAREARSVAAEVCGQLKTQPLFAAADSQQTHGLGALCLVSGMLPVFEFDMAPTESRLVPNLPGYEGPRIAIVGPDGHVESSTGSVMQWVVPVPTAHEREILWCQYLGDTELAARLAREHVHGAGRIMELSQLAMREAQLNQRDKPLLDDVYQAAWSAEEGSLGSLAQPITARIPDQALVLPDSTRQELLHLMQRCMYRESLDQALGVTVRSRYQMGVKALLVGPSGTGKTLVASWIASRLGLPLYRVDLASVVSKYIGETEKNLASLLARAEQSEIVLLFDEADSLFGKRTDIKDSNDRHANSQTNYLLQRIEFYKGIVLLTSNSRGRFDSAFTRRLDKVIEFALPAPEERRALWQTHLGDAHGLTIKQLNQLSVASDLAGGYIRNAVLAAAVQARIEQRPINYADIVMGLNSEYRKLGRKLPAEIQRA